VGWTDSSRFRFAAKVEESNKSHHCRRNHHLTQHTAKAGLDSSLPTHANLGVIHCPHIVYPEAKAASWPGCIAMEYLIRFAQVHESFRRPEIQALAALAGIDLEIISYNEFVGASLTFSPDRGSPSTSDRNDLGGGSGWIFFFVPRASIIRQKYIDISLHAQLTERAVTILHCQVGK
jgi:hypothetical protein